MMTYGMPTLVECKDIYDCAHVARENNLDFIEINMSFPQYQTESLDVTALARLAKENSLYYTIHADEQMNPFDFNKNVSACYFEEMRKCIRFAKALENMTSSDFDNFDDGELPTSLTDIIMVDPKTGNFVSKEYNDIVIGTIYDVFDAREEYVNRMETYEYSE